MRLRTKKNAIAILVLALLVWPPLQMAAVTRYDINPWKFFAWGMYSRTPTTLEVTLGEIAAPGRPPRPPRAWSDATRAAVHDFLRWRTQWGRLQRLDDVAAVALREHPDLHGIAIRLEEGRVDPATSVLETTAHVATFHRDDPL